MIGLTDFQYFEPTNLDDTLSLLSQYGEKAKVLAGGTDVIPLMKRRAISPAGIVNIKRISELRFIEFNKKDGLRMGALTRVSDIDRSGEIRENFPILCEAARLFATSQVRNMATVGGNLCRGSPAADMAPPLLALDAKVQVAGPKGKRTVPLDKLWKGPGSTVVEPNQILTEIDCPIQQPNTGAAFVKMTRTAEDLAKINLAVAVTVSNRTCRDARIALGSVAPTPLRCLKAEATLRGKTLDERTIAEAARITAEEVSPITDVRSTSEYRRIVSGVMLARALRMALARVKYNG